MDVAEFMRLYPVAYFACHGSHSGETALSSRQWQLLSHLNRNETTRPTDLARHLGVSGATVSVALDRLELEGFVERVRDVEDGRASLVLLTAEGDAALVASSALDSACVAVLLEGMNSEEQEVVERGLRTLAEAVRRRS